MADLSGVTTNFFPVASETYTNNINATIAALAATVPVNAATAYTDGDIVVLTVDPGTANQATFTGVKASAPDRFVTCKWTEGNVGVGHANGAVITDYDSATHYNLVTKGVRTFANLDGSLKSLSVQNALNLGAGTLNGWNALAYTFNSVTYLGNRSYSCVTNTQDLTGTLSAGFRLRTTRTVAAPTQSTSLDGSTKYWSKVAPAGMTFTDTFSISAYVKLVSYNGLVQNIVRRGTNTSGFALDVDVLGTVRCFGTLSAGNYKGFTSYQSVPLNKWVHIVATFSMSTGAGNMYFDGMLIPTFFGPTVGTANTLLNTGDLSIGSIVDGTSKFTGKIAQVAVFSRVLTNAEAQSIYSQSITSTQITALNAISVYDFNGNANDLNTTNANNLTANGAAGYTTDAPWTVQANSVPNGTQDYGILQSIAYTGGNTVSIVQVPEGCAIPTTGGVLSVAYSSVRVPYGFPGQRGKWQIFIPFIAPQLVNIGAITTWVQSQARITIPIGEWVRTIKYSLDQQSSVTGARRFYYSFSDVVPTTGNSLTSYSEALNTTDLFVDTTAIDTASLTTATTYYIFGYIFTASGAEIYIVSQRGVTTLTAENAYL